MRMTSEARLASDALVSTGFSMPHVHHSHGCAALIEIHSEILLKLFMEASCCFQKRQQRYAGMFEFILSSPPTILSHFVSPARLSLVLFCCLCMISVLHSPLYLPPASPQPSISRSLYRNRSFLRIPLAARPRFSSLRSLRFVLPHSAKVKEMPPLPPTPLLPYPPKVHVVHMLQRSSTEGSRAFHRHYMECR